MNRGILSFIVLIFTTITVGVMFWSTSSKYKLVNEISKESLKDDLIREQLEIDKIVKGIKRNIISENIVISNNSNDIDFEITDNEKNIISSGEKHDEKQKNEKSIEISKDKYNLEEKSSKGKLDKKPESMQVFKVDKHSIPSKIKRGDKLKLLSIAKNLSIVDYGVLLEHIKRSDELGAAVDIFKILKDKLNDEDYNLIKGVMEPYINIELIEDNI